LAVIVDVDVIDLVIVAALVIGNDIVGVTDTVDAQGSISVFSIVTMRSSIERCVAVHVRDAPRRGIRIAR
jgi:hypothetical protein